MNKTILVTGGSGLIGNGIQSFVNKNNINKYNFIFLSSKDCDLRNLNDTRKIFLKHKPDYVIHLAAKVGGLYANMNYPVEFYRDNILMNDVVMELCHEFKVEKLISCLSTCVFPDKITYPIDETMIHIGPPHSSNAAYSYAKRMIDIMNQSYNKEYGCNFTSVIPTNIYGPNDNFDLENGHVLPALIHKAYISKRDNTDFIIFGSGKPLRQFIFNKDLGELFLHVLENYDSIEPIILSVDEKDEVSIEDIAYLIAEAFDIDKSKIKFDKSKSDGQFKKTASNKKLRTLLPEYKFTKLKDGIFETCDWFKNNYENVKKIAKKLYVENGQYVVPRNKDEWVYDILVKNNGTDICTVGFTKNQTEGALFFNNFEDVNNYYCDQDSIKRIAKEYALSHGVTW